MPLYDFRCTTGCGVFEDWMCDSDERTDQTCPECGGALRVLIAPVRTVGPMASKPLEIKQIGKRFESNAELRAYQREHNVEFHESNSRWWKDYKDSVREKCERSAKRQGFTDLEERRRFLRAEKST